MSVFDLRKVVEGVPEKPMGEVIAFGKVASKFGHSFGSLYGPQVCAYCGESSREKLTQPCEKDWRVARSVEAYQIMERIKSRAPKPKDNRARKAMVEAILAKRRRGKPIQWKKIPWAAIGIWLFIAAGAASLIHTSLPKPNSATAIALADNLRNNHDEWTRGQFADLENEKRNIQIFGNGKSTRQVLVTFNGDHLPGYNERHGPTPDEKLVTKAVREWHRVEEKRAAQAAEQNAVRAAQKLTEALR